MTHSCVPWLIQKHAFRMTHLCVPYVPWLIHVCLDSFMCTMTHSARADPLDVSRIECIYIWFFCIIVTCVNMTLSNMCDIQFSYCGPNHRSFLFVVLPLGLSRIECTCVTLSVVQHTLREYDSFIYVSCRSRRAASSRRVTYRMAMWLALPFSASFLPHAVSLRAQVCTNF